MSLVILVSILGLLVDLFIGASILVLLVKWWQRRKKKYETLRRVENRLIQIAIERKREQRWEDKSRPR